MTKHHMILMIPQLYWPHFNAVSNILMLYNHMESDALYAWL